MMSDELDFGSVDPSEAGEWALLEAHVPGVTQTIGVLLCETSRNTLHLQLRPDWWSGCFNEIDAEIFQELGEDLKQKAKELGATECLDWLQDTASHAVRIGLRRPIRLLDVQAGLEALYREHISAPQSHSSDSIITLPRMIDRRSGICQHGHRMGSRAPRSSGWARTKLVNAAIAASFVLVTVISSNRPQRVHQEFPRTDQATSDSHGVPLFPTADYRNVSFATGPELKRFCDVGCRLIKQHKRPAFYRKKFRGLASAVRPLLVQAAQIEPPPIILTTEPYPGILASLPEPQQPRYQRHRNRFLRVLAVVAVPFRMLPFHSKAGVAN